MSCKGLHCPGCGDSGGGGGLLALVAVVIIAAIIARPVMHAASAVGHVIAEILHVLLITAETAGIAAAAIGAIALAAYVTGRIRDGRAHRRAVRQAAERDLVADILHRERLAPPVWHATVIQPEQQQITTPTGDRQC